MSRNHFAFSCSRVSSGGSISAAVGAIVVLGLLPVAASGDTNLSSTQSRTGPTAATTKEAAKQAITRAKAIVEEALYHEIYGADEERSSKLTEAQNIAPEFPLAKWQAGYIRDRKDWIKLDDIPKRAESDPALNRYLAKRRSAPDTAHGHLELAHWCEGRGLANQAAAHYTAVLLFKPDHAEAQAKLGFTRINGEWVSVADVERKKQEALAIEKAIEKWQPKIKKIREGLLSDTAKVQKFANEELQKIDDPAAIPALERGLSLIDEYCASCLIQKLSAWNDPRATRALAMQSVASPWETTRKSAAEKLRDRPFEDYVPEMLAALRGPAQKETLVYNDNGWLVIRDLYVIESQDSWDAVAIDNAYGHVQGLSRNAYFESALGSYKTSQLLVPKVAQSRVPIQKLDFQLYLHNMQSELRRSLIMESLAIATGQQALTKPSDWWNWWEQLAERENGDLKPVNAQVVRKQILFDTDREFPNGDAEPIYYETPYIYDPPPLQLPPYNPSCFVAGTQVWTNRGQCAIEEMRIGDVVFAQHPDTGELTLKPVVRTTVRPAVPTFEIETSGGKLHCTGGHLFWVAGEGWTKARHLKSGHILHCATGTVKVSEVTEAAPAPTYNLVVADFNTYFVGPEKIYTHDVTDRKPTRALVPGLLRE